MRQHPREQAVRLTVGQPRQRSRLYTPACTCRDPIGFRTVDPETGHVELATELLALKKMNWNATPLDGRQPVT